jgi:phage gpG-like protein
MTPEVTIEIGPEAQQLIDKLRDNVGLGQVIARAMNEENKETVAQVKRKLTGPVLKVQSGQLRRSIQHTDAVVVTAVSGASGALEVRSSVGSNVRTGGDSVFYAAIHEFGKDIHHPPRPRKVGPGRRGGMTKDYWVHMPERSFLRSTVNERIEDYSRTVSGAIVGFLGGRA